MANTIVEYMHEHGGYRCGYCGGSDSNFSHGMWAHSLSCEDYQDLVDRGWRRSGSYLYKPLMDKMCCPCYTIRCGALDFRPSKSQKKVIKRTIRYLSSGERPDSNKRPSEDSNKDDEEEVCPGMLEHPAQEKKLLRKMTAASAAATTAAAVSTSPPNPIPMQNSTLKTTSESIGNSNSRSDRMQSDRVDDQQVVQDKCAKKMKGTRSASVKSEIRPGVGADPTKPQCKKAKELRRQRRLDRLSQSGVDAASVDIKKPDEPKSLEELIQEAERASQGQKHKLEIRYVRSSPMNRKFENTFKESYSIYRKYQITIHKDPPSKPSEKQFKLVRSHLESREFQETFKESHIIFAKYQTTIHKEDPSECRELDFKRFLVDSPLCEEHLPGAPECGYGSFHEHFILDGKIIAVGVIDILPSCISSVYFYYDPDYSFLSLGTYSALRELEFTRLLHLQAPKITHYYMGFYIHSCPKMRYKGNYKQSFLLCPETYTWQLIERCIPKLEAKKYSRLDETDAVDTSVTLENVNILHMKMSMHYSDYRTFAPDAGDEEEIQEYARRRQDLCREDDAVQTLTTQGRCHNE